MFRRSISSLKAAILATALLASPCSVSAQRGAAGGHAGGGTATGGGLATVGRSTGVDAKDDLKDFHATLAVQATSEQIIAYAAMLKTTDAAIAELRPFLEPPVKHNAASETTGRAAPLTQTPLAQTPLTQAIEKARSENKKFLDGFSDDQKSGLKEITKRLIKDDSDLAQPARDLSERLADPKAADQAIATAAQSLDHALAAFRAQQLDLGEEMSIGGERRQDSAFNLAPVKNSVNFTNRSIVVTTSGVVSKAMEEGGQSVFALELTADLSDLQQHITEVLRAQLNQAPRCGERIEVLSATLEPSTPASTMLVQLHYERWACLGREVNEMAEGNGTVEIKLTPSVRDDGKLALAAEIGRVDADGRLGDLLRSGSLGETVRAKVTGALHSALTGSDFKAILPPVAEDYTTLRHAEFQGNGSIRLVVVLDGEIRIPRDKTPATWQRP